MPSIYRKQISNKYVLIKLEVYPNFEDKSIAVHNVFDQQIIYLKMNIWDKIATLQKSIFD